jgi:hypothetical protein
MTRDKRAKKDARERSAITGERYVEARRRTARGKRYFENDCCANCLKRLPDEVEGLFCSEVCSQTAETVRYWRRIVRDGRIEQPDIAEAVRTRVAHLMGGGYHRSARQLSASARHQVWERDKGICVLCGKRGTEIDHIEGDSSELDNLQLLCTACHHTKTNERMSPAGPEHVAAILSLQVQRVTPTEPALLCDDEERWPREWAGLKRARRGRLLTVLEDFGLDPDEFRGMSRSDLLFELQSYIADSYDEGEYDDDTGYGPYSYFARAMAKDD